MGYGAIMLGLFTVNCMLFVMWHECSWTRQAVLGNNENIIIQDTPAVVAEFRKYYEFLWAKFSAL